jgi:hypothetical protein
MPLGRRHFEPEALRVPLADEFSKAEMTAAIEAVEAIDDVEVVDVAAAHPARGDADSTSETLDAVEATEADDSVAMRVALMSDGDGLDTAEFASAEGSDDTETTEAERALAEATIAMRIALLADAEEMEAAERAFGAGDFETDEFEAAEFLAGHQAAQQGRAALQEVEAAASLESAEATFGVAAERPPEPEIEDPGRLYAQNDDEDAAEEEAQAQASREAPAIVLGGEDEAAPVGAAEVPLEVPVVEVAAVEVPVVEVPVVDTSHIEGSSETGVESREPRKKGLFRRFRR